MLSFLIVEDNQNIAEMIKLMLVENYPNCFIRTCGDGEAAMGLCSRVHFDVVLTDINMPKMTGDRFISNLRHDFSCYEKSPVIVLSSFVDKLSELEKVPATYFLSKPFNSKELLRVTNLSRMAG